MDLWYGTGYEFCHLNNPFDDIPEDIYDEMCHHAEDTDYIGYNFWECALIARKTISRNSLVPPMVTSTWGAFTPYSDSSSYPLGCSTLAAGQIMRYFQYPTTFCWSDMPDAISSHNPTLCGFLVTLKNAIGVDSGGGASINQVKNALEGYGYTCHIQSHNTLTMNYALEHERPVYCRGKNVNNNISHAWVCDGKYEFESYTHYILFTLSFQNGSPIGYEENETYDIPISSFVLYHINWGHAGLYNGNYFDSYLQYENSYGDVASYTSNERQELLIHH